jgi:membrane associated rhomboid family serine protease
MSDPVEKKLPKGRLSLIVVALIVVGVVVYFAYPPLGILVLVAAVVAMIGTVIASFRRTKEGVPIDAKEKVRIFAGTLGSAFLVLIASSIAFIATCFPIGLFGTKGEGGDPADDRMIRIAYIVGGIAAVVAGCTTVYFLDRVHRARSTEEPRKKRRW